MQAPIALLGFGEVGQALADQLGALPGVDIAAWDRLFARTGSVPQAALRHRPRVRAAGSLAEALEGADLVISAVTAGECLALVREAGPLLHANTHWLDVNSVSPGTRLASATLFAAGKARYVEAAIMSPIAPRGIGSPMLLGGPHASEWLTTYRPLGFSGAQVYSAEYGRASAAKMCRSVMIKGLEALMAEALLSARHHGVEGTVLESMQNLLPGADWPGLARYMISRSIAHGRRRAEEMREVARTVEEASLSAWMSAACVERQTWAAATGEGLDTLPLEGLLDGLLSRVGRAAASMPPHPPGSGALES